MADVSKACEVACEGEVAKGTILILLFVHFL